MNETQRNELRAKIERIGPKSLPANPTASGFSWAQIIAAFCGPNDTLLDAIFALDDAINGIDQDSLDRLIEQLENGQSVVARTKGDKDGAQIDTTYAKIANIVNGVIAVKKYIKENGDFADISTLESAVNTLTSALNTYKNNVADGTIVVKKAEVADTAQKANRDSAGNQFTTFYATVSALNAIRDLFTKLENGTTASKKAYQDQNGDIIDQTYVKKTQIVNDLISTATNQPLSAYQGKILYGYIQAIQTLLTSNDTDLDTVQEIVTYIKNNKSVLDTFSASKVNVSDIVDDLLSSVSGKPLSAKQGYLLKGYIDNIISGVTIVKEAEKATKDSDGNIIKNTYIRSVNGLTPVNGNIVLGGFLGFQTYENGDYLKLKAVWSGDLGGEIGVLEQGDYKYLTFTPTGSQEYVILNRIAQSDAKILFAFQAVCEAVIQASMKEINHYIAYLVEED